MICAAPKSPRYKSGAVATRFRPNYVNQHSVGYVAALLLHEVAHTIGAIDPQLKAALGFLQTDPSSYINDKLAKDCFGVTK